MSICYQFVGWNVVDEFDVVWKFLNGWWGCFAFCFGSSLFLVLGFNFLICCYSFVDFGINLPFFGVDYFVFCKRFEGRCSTPIFELRFWTIWLSTLKEPSLVRIFIGRFELRIRTSLNMTWILIKRNLGFIINSTFKFHILFFFQSIKERIVTKLFSHYPF